MNSLLPDKMEAAWWRFTFLMALVAWRWGETFHLIAYITITFGSLIWGGHGLLFNAHGIAMYSWETVGHGVATAIGFSMLWAASDNR